MIVIGVHSAKYTTEKDDRHLAAAIRRNNIEHPVVNDGDMNIWSQYGVRAWPTLMFLDPENRVFGKHEGEFRVEQMVPVVEQMIAEFDSEGLIDRRPLDFLKPPEPIRSTLAFPLGLHADAATNRLYIADTNHNRVVVTTLDGELQQVIGSGGAGLDDGRFEEATFNRPHGLTLDGDTLYVADTDNHAIRRVDLRSGVVTTLAGTGRQAYSYVSGGPARETDLNTPWDVTLLDGVLYIAMAGNHQLWAHELGSDEVRRLAGTGHEGIRDGTLANAWLAQPSGIDGFDGQLFFADAETSAIRAAGISGPTAGTLTTLVGKDLFVWGDTDGPLGAALLQHPTGVAVDPESGALFVSDTYNNKIKRLDPVAGTIKTWLAGGLFEPHGVSLSGDTLYIADTNNHAIRRAALAAGEMTTIEVRGLS